MRLWAFLRSLASALFHRSRIEGEMDEELRSHIQTRVEDLERSGLAPAEAERRARIEFGGYQKIKEECREALGTHFIETLVQDVRFGLRMLRKAPAFTTVAVLTLALGIGVSTAIFSVVDWMILRPLPVQAPEQLAYLGFARENSNTDTQFSYPELQEIRHQAAKEFSHVAAFYFGGTAGDESGPDGLTVNGETKPVQLAFVSGNFFSMLGIRPEMGRFILPSEGDVAGADAVAVLSYGYWQSRFGRDTAIVGKAVSMNARRVTIVGVAPRGFLGPTPVIEMQAYLPLGMAVIETGENASFLSNPKTRSLVLLGRLAPGVSFEQARPAMKVIGERIAKQFRPSEKVGALFAEQLRPPGIINGENPLPKTAALFLTLAALVLMLACVNVGSLLLVRSAGRFPEMAVRAALGAPRERLIRQMLTESVLLALLGGASGIAVGLAASRALSSVPLPTETPIVFDLHFDWRVFAFAVGMALATGILLGIVPALRISRGNLSRILHEGGRTATASRQRLRSALVAGQVGASLTLLIVAGLFVRNLGTVKNAELGFDPHNVLNLTIDPAEIGYTKAQGQEFYRRLLERVRALPGVESASFAALVPLGETVNGDTIQVPGYRTAEGQGEPSAQYNAVTSDYFKTMRVRMIRGRDLTDADSELAPRVAVINEAMAKKYWPKQDAVGRQFVRTGDPTHVITVVGIVKNSRMADLYSAIDPCFYFPLAQGYVPVETLQVRTSAAPEAMSLEVMSVVQSLAPAMPVFGVRTMTRALGGMNGLFFFQVAAGLTAFLGSLGLILAIVGVYGVMSYAVSQRTHDIGIRMALGAQPGEILAMVCRQGLRIIAGGLAVGLALAFAIGEMVRDFLVGVGPTDAVSYLGVSALLGVVALAACYIPARRAVRVDPMVALRYE